jgi:hypothetical protein
MISLAAWLLIVVDDRFRGAVNGSMLRVYGLPLGLMAAGALIDRSPHADHRRAHRHRLSFTGSLRWPVRASSWSTPGL